MQGNRWLFPAFNSIITLILGGGMGYLIGPLWLWVVASFAVGLLLGFVVEFGLGATGFQTTRLYRFRVILLVLLEVPIFLFAVGPYMFIIQRTQPDPHDICCETPADFGAAYETIHFETYDGLRLAGWYVAPPDSGDALVILLHGLGTDRTATLPYAEVLYQAGYGLLMYDERALGESEGTVQSFGWLDVADVSAAIDFIITQPAIDPQHIGVLGLSLGGHIALPAAAQDERIAAVWADGVAAQHGADYPPSIHAADYVVRFYYYLLDLSLSVRLGMSATPIVDMIELIHPRPIFLVAGGQTELEARSGENYLQHAGDNAELWIIPDGGHVSGFEIVADEYRQRLITFFDAALRIEG